MIPRWVALSDGERVPFNTVTTFLHGRLEEQATVEWALRLDVRERVKRLAVLHLLDTLTGQQLSEPWRSAWRLIEESWNTDVPHRGDGGETHSIRERLQGGDRSGSLVAEIANLVKPTLEVKPLSEWSRSHQSLPRRPNKVADLMSVRMISGDVVDPDELGLGDVKERAFLVELADVMDAALVSALHLGRRVGWDGGEQLWLLGQIRRVYYVAKADRPAEEHEPDEFHHGIEPLVKLLFAGVSRLIEVDVMEALVLANRWRQVATPVHIRLWAALARDHRMASPLDVAEFLRGCDARRFWDLHVYPEIAELRARRFAELDLKDQRDILARLRRQPPRRQWPAAADKALVDDGRLYWTVRELRRIEIAGGQLPDDQRAWVEAHLPQFEDLNRMLRLDEGFLGMPKARFVPPDPDDRYDVLTGVERLKGLEKALATGRRGWDDNPARRASDWMRQEGRAKTVLADFEQAPVGGGAYPKLWDMFGWLHTPSAISTENEQVDDIENVTAQAKRVLALLARLPQRTIDAAIEGISAWMDSWRTQMAVLPESVAVWFRIWPFAVEATNAQQPSQEAPDLNIVVRNADNRDPADLDTHNTPAGKLVGVFLAACPTVKGGERPFNTNVELRDMRDAVVSATGRSGLIAHHRMIEALQWFLLADPDWANEHLVSPLRVNSDEALVLWRAVAHQTRFKEVLEIIGEMMAERSVDPRLGRETRRSLVFSLVIESLHAFREERNPAVPNARILQMLRSLDDEVRAHAAEAVQRFVRDLSSKTEKVPDLPLGETLFRQAVQPFLERVWPQERSLSTPGVARAFADLPATCGQAFAEAVNAIERFLVPFECWSLLDYGLYGKEGDEAKLSQIDDQPKAEAFLRLLDLTIGTAEGAVVPFDLGNALEQIRVVAPQFAETQSFRRLATLARR
jgi:hypothetical protein